MKGLIYHGMMVTIVLEPQTLVYGMWRKKYYVGCELIRSHCEKQKPRQLGSQLMLQLRDRLSTHFQVSNGAISAVGLRIAAPPQLFLEPRLFDLDNKKNICLLIMIKSHLKKVIDIISNVRKTKWSWAWHINGLKDDRWTSRVTTWRP